MLDCDPGVTELVVPVQGMTERMLGTSCRVRRSFHVSNSPPGLKGLNNFLYSLFLGNLVFSQLSPEI